MAGIQAASLISSERSQKKKRLRSCAVSNRIQRARGCGLNKNSEACDIARVGRTLLSAAFPAEGSRVSSFTRPAPYSKAPATQAQRFGFPEKIAEPLRRAATTGSRPP